MRTIADMIDQGACDNMTDDDLKNVTEALRPLFDIGMTYDQAAKAVGCSKGALYAKISRCGFRPRQKKLIPFSLVKKIKDKTI